MRSWVIVSVVAILAAVTTLEIVSDKADPPAGQIASPVTPMADERPVLPSGPAAVPPPAASEPAPPVAGSPPLSQFERPAPVAERPPAASNVIEYTEGELRRNPREPLPRTRPATWFGPRDYPTAQRRSRTEGRVGFRIAVDEYGEVSECEVTSSSGVAAFDNRVCAIISSRARFHPALDDDQQPVTGEWESAVVWALPDGEYLN